MKLVLRTGAILDADWVSCDVVDLAVHSGEAGDAWLQSCDVDGLNLDGLVGLGLAAVGSYVVRPI